MKKIFVFILWLLLIWVAFWYTSKLEVWPKWWCYYINNNWKKTYVDKSECSKYTYIEVNDWKISAWTSTKKESNKTKKTYLWSWKQYKVVKVVDWDSISIKYNNKTTNIRMIWVDAPESTASRFWYIECYWKESKKYLTDLLSWKNTYVTIETDISQWETDFYKRILWYVFLSWININQKIINDWYWREYTYQKNYIYQSNFKEAQINAKKLGLWLRNKKNCNWERIKINK